MRPNLWCVFAGVLRWAVIVRNRVGWGCFSRAVGTSVVPEVYLDLLRMLGVQPQ